MNLTRSGRIDEFDQDHDHFQLEPSPGSLANNLSLIELLDELGTWHDPKRINEFGKDQDHFQLEP